MKPERWQRIDQILDGALEREGNQRKAFLEEACSGDASLRQEVESLIQADERVKSFIESPALEQRARTVAQTRVQSSLAGQEIGFYKILSLLGRGGMGEVYLAQDTNLHRKVALKFLTEQFTQDDERLARFRREARLLASLNHPSIAAIHGLEESGGVRFLVLELVEGETLSQRRSRGPLPVDEALDVSRQIAEGLEAAHESGVIHRDLKPANIKITPDGTVKILDFGLAKAAETGGSEAANSRSLTMEATREGIVLGTAAYMSPEQARGQVVDKRTDIWSFGLLLFEMLTGKGMYADKSLTETIAAVIHQEPSLEDLPGDTPERIRDLLERCLRKDPRMRLRDMGDARITIDECLRGEATLEEPLVPLTPPPLRRRLVPWAVVPILVILAAGFRPDVSAPEKLVSRWEIPVGKGKLLNHFFRRGVALSPDGTRLAFVSATDASWEARGKVYIRSFNQWNSAVALADNSAMPFFSPDGNWLGVITDPEDDSPKKMVKHPLDGGPPITICDCPVPNGASWSSDGTVILACRPQTGLSRVSASGGEPEQITELDRETQEVSHRLPHVLPNGKAVLFTVLRYNPHRGRSDIAVQSFETGAKKVLIEDGADARYVPTGHLVFARDATLMAASFDLASLTLTGPPIPILEGVSQAIHVYNQGLETRAAQFDFSDTGSLAYIAGSSYPEARFPVVWVDRSGAVEALDVEPAQYVAVRLSPDSKQALLSTNHKTQDIWIQDLTRGARPRETFEGHNLNPIWKPDGSGFAFSSSRTGPPNLFWKSLESTAEVEHLIPSPHNREPGSWSPDGTKLAFVQWKAETRWGYDIWILSMDGSGSAEPFLQESFKEFHPAFSPDGRWLAYTSDESGRYEVYVRPYPGPGSRIQISTSGGWGPAWSGDGRELFYRSVPSRKKMLAVEIEVSGSSLKPGKPAFLFEGKYMSMNPIRSYDVAPDGQRFLMIPYGGEGNQARVDAYFGNKVSVIVNWFEELERLVPTS